MNSVSRLGNERLSLGEGPLWNRQKSLLAVVDLNENRLVEVDGLTGRLVSSTTFESAVGCVGLRKGGGYVVATAGKVALLDSELATDTEIPGLPAGWRFNDGKVSPLGDMWLGVTHVDYRRGAGRLEILSGKNLERRVIVESMTLPNGLDWSSNDFFHIDSFDRTITRYPYRNEITGPGQTFFVERSEALPDGMCLDSEGSVWVAFWGAGEVRRYSVNGELQEAIGVPAIRVSSCALGGPDLRTLFITTARGPGESDGEGGAIFTVRVKTPGMLPHEFSH